MKTFFNNKYIQLIPEISLLIITLIYWNSSRLMNPIAFVFTAILIYILVTKNKIVSLIFAGIFLTLSLYMVLAFLSDFHKIETFDAQANKFVLYGVLFLFFSILMSTLLILKNVTSTTPITQLNKSTT